MKLSLPSRLLREALTDAPSGEYIDKLLEKINADAEQTNQALMQNLTFGENMNAAIVPYDLTHGVEKKIPNPLKARPVGIYAIRSKAINGGTQYAIESFKWRFVDSDDPKQTQQIGVTMMYAPPFGLASVCRTAAYDTPNNTNDPFPYDTTITSGGAASLDIANKGIKCSQAGVVFASYAFEWAASAAGTDRKAFIWLNQSTLTEIWGRVLHGPTTNAMSGSGLITVAAGDVVGVAHNQNTGGVLALNAGIRRHKMDLHYVSPPLDAQNNVTLLVIGG